MAMLFLSIGDSNFFVSADSDLTFYLLRFLETLKLQIGVLWSLTSNWRESSEFCDSKENSS